MTAANEPGWAKKELDRAQAETQKPVSSLIPKSSAAIEPERLRWIESWATGWRSALTARYGDKDYYAQLPLDVAVSMIEELVAAVRAES